MKRFLWENLLSAWFLAALLAQFASPATLSGAEPRFRFRDAAAEAGLLPAIENTQGHAAGWGDFDNDGQLDLYLGTFAGERVKPNILLRQNQGKFEAVDDPTVAIPTRATGALFSDLDNDGDLDLYVASMPQAKTSIRGCALFRNDGGKFVDVSADNAACPEAFGGRSATSVDVDGDGLLDLLVGEDPLPGYNGSPTKRSRLFQNRGELKFADITDEAGLPDAPGLGVAAGDLNGDGWPDLFLAAHNGGNRLLVNDRSGKFREASALGDLFDWPGAGGDNMVCGVTLADVNRDGRLDILLGPHFKTPWRTPVAPRLFLNQTEHGAEPSFVERTEESGLRPLALKAPHIEVQDFDNDGWPDIAVSIVKFAGGTPAPIIFRQVGLDGGMPRFELQGWDVNDFPTAADQAIGRTGDFFAKMLKEGKILYAAPMPAADYDQDGRVDLFCASWWAERPSLLLHNETPGGHWLQVALDSPQGVNRMGVGAAIAVYRAGMIGDDDALLFRQEISTGYGYASAHSAQAHFGLGEHAAVDVRITWPHGKGTFDALGVKADRQIRLRP